jgi:oligoribonuclease (3'-5' exoribonuclease)
MFKHLRLRRPLTFLDVETTGVDPRRDRIIDIALIRPGLALDGVGRRSCRRARSPRRPYQ